MAKLIKPLKDIYITQPFGVNLVGKGFYSQFGLPADAHNGIDFRCFIGCMGYATHDGIALLKTSKAFGKYIVLNNIINGNGYDTIYGHLSKFLVKDGQEVKQGDPMFLTGNSGSASTAPHLHFAYRDWVNGRVADLDNGYLGSKDPAIHLPKDWDMPNAYHRYGRKREYLAEVKMRFQNQWLHRQLLKLNSIKKIYDDIFINALVYGGWDFQTVIDPAMQDWKWVTKEEYNKGRHAFK